VKFVAFWEMDPKDFVKVKEKFEKRDKRPGAAEFKTIFGPAGYGGQFKGFTVFEAEKTETLSLYSQFYAPELTVVIYPLIDSSLTVQLWEKYFK
jgi:hypothetical protein